MAQLSREQLVKLMGKKQMHRQWKHGQVTWEGHRGEVQLCRDKMRNNSLELNLERDTNHNRKGFCRYTNQKSKVKEGVTPSDKQGQQSGNN